MKKNLIPNTDLLVSELCLGTMTFGDRMDLNESKNAVAAAMDAGINFYDTADVYTIQEHGISERYLGEAIKGIRDKIVLATKCGGAMGPGPDDKGLGRVHMHKAVDASLERLGTDWVDLLYFHFPDPDVPFEEMIESANDLIKAGKIRYYGVSNFSAWQVCEMILLARQMGLQPPVASESVYNLLTRGIEDEFIPFLKKYPMGLVTYNPLCGGMLTGKYSSMTPPEGTRFQDNPGYARRYFLPENVDAAIKLGKIADEAGMSLIELSLKWLLHSQSVHSVILGFSSVKQLLQNVESAERPAACDLPIADIDAVWTELTGRRYSYHH